MVGDQVSPSMNNFKVNLSQTSPNHSIKDKESQITFREKNIFGRRKRYKPLPTAVKFGGLYL
jgi:hypothetical protein